MSQQSDRTTSDEVIGFEDLLASEAEQHDRDYTSCKPFGLPTLSFTPDDVWRINDYPFKKGAYKRGYRKRRLFQVMDLDHIAGKKVLDVGCGIGQHTVFHALHGAESHGFDISSVGVAVGARMAQANNVADLCHFNVASVSDLPYKDDYFDIVVLNAVLHHIIKYPGVHAEILRVLKPGGKLFVADELRNPIYKAVRRCYRSLARDKPERGDVDLSMADLNEFSQGYTNLRLERFTLLEGLREGFARAYNNRLPTRAVSFLLFAADQALFYILPATRNYASEFIIIMEKPLHARAEAHTGTRPRHASLQPLGSVG
jgi:ubiquinone/menaquinone biosynthesis C-methylase UbiE